MNLLLVDDDVITLKGMLAGIDFAACGIDGEVLLAHDAAQARALIEAQPVDVMLCDIEMPGQNGIELLRHVRASRPDIACVFLTCHAKFEYAREAIELGCADYILKPAPYEKIAETLRRASDQLREQRDQQKMQQYGEHWLSQRQQSAAKAQGDHRSAADIASETTGYILAHLADEALSVQQLAKRSFLNEDYLGRVFKRETGVSISQYIIRERMELAVRLLKDPALSLSTIAAEVGYPSYPHFVASFKKVYGMTPTEYRKHLVANP